MKISSKGRYAVRSMSEIAKNPDNCVSVSEIAERKKTCYIVKKLWTILEIHEMSEKSKMQMP